MRCLNQSSANSSKLMVLFVNAVRAERDSILHLKPSESKFRSAPHRIGQENAARVLYFWCAITIIMTIGRSCSNLLPSWLSND